MGQYLKDFEGDFQSLLRNKFPRDLREAQSLACQLENNIKWYEPTTISQVDSIQDEIVNFRQIHEIQVNDINIMEEGYNFYEIPKLEDERNLRPSSKAL
jgi:hypothetical protein